MYLTKRSHFLIIMHNRTTEIPDFLQLCHTRMVDFRSWKIVWCYDTRWTVDIVGRIAGSVLPTLTLLISPYFCLLCFLLCPLCFVERQTRRASCGEPNDGGGPCKAKRSR